MLFISRSPICINGDTTQNAMETSRRKKNWEREKTPHRGWLILLWFGMRKKCIGSSSTWKIVRCVWKEKKAKEMKLDIQWFECVNGMRCTLTASLAFSLSSFPLTLIRCDNDDNDDVDDSAMTTFASFSFNYHRNFNAFNESIKRNYIRWVGLRALVLKSYSLIHCDGDAGTRARAYTPIAHRRRA